jgi:hypothetical protein
VAVDSVVVVMVVMISKIGWCRERSVAGAMAMTVGVGNRDWEDWDRDRRRQGNGTLADDDTVVVIRVRPTRPVTIRALLPRRCLREFTLDDATHTARCSISYGGGAVDVERTVFALDMDVVVGVLLLEGTLLLHAALLLDGSLLVLVLLGCGRGGALALLGGRRLGLATVLGSGVASSLASGREGDVMRLQEPLVALGSVGGEGE